MNGEVIHNQNYTFDMINCEQCWKSKIRFPEYLNNDKQYVYKIDVKDVYLE